MRMSAPPLCWMPRRWMSCVALRTTAPRGAARARRAAAPHTRPPLTLPGFMPAKVTLFNAACKPVYDLGSGPYNVVRWNPFGRFFAIAGFGNLPGAAGSSSW
jgi:hypothetical protein